MANVAAPSVVGSTGLPTALFVRLRGGSWRRWVAVVLAFNIALGMGFSVVALRHQADARSRADALFADLNAAASAQDAVLWRATTGATDPAVLAAAGHRVDVAADRVAATPDGADDADVFAAVTTYQREAAVARDALIAGSATAIARVAEVQQESVRLQEAVDTAGERHREANESAGRVADFETLFMMVFAAVMAGLLFRRFEAARRSGELGVAAAKAQGEARFRALVHHSSDLITLVDADLAISYQTPSITRLLGYSEDELIGTQLADLTHPEDRLSLVAARAEATAEARATTTSQLRLRHRDGSYRHVQSIHTNLLDDPDVRAVVVTTRDVTEQKQLEAQLQHNAFHDTLTGLANRALFADRLDHALARTDRLAAPVAVLFVDLDDFKAVNDGSGHTAGDDLLVAVADRLRRTLRPSDTIARLGGDEFAVLIEDAAEPGRPEAAAQRLLGALAEPFVAAGDGAEVRITASVGIAMGAAGQHDAAELLRHADVAMYAAKAAGKGRSAVFEPEMDSAIIGQLQMKAELARAVERGEFTVYYQPTVELANGRLAGVEALVRWQHPERGLVPPLDFIPLAEQTGLIVPIGRYVLREACQQMRAWHTSYPTTPPMTVSVNLSARELDEPGLVDSVRDVLVETGLDPAHLILEITESLLLVDLPATVTILSALRALGVRLAIDDFGTGYSSLSYLENLPVDILKIDKSFVDRIGETPADIPGVEDPNQSVMVSAISQLGHALHLDLVAEGIEQREQVSTLQGLACQYGQGYYFARPLTSGALAELLHRQADEPGWNLEPSSQAVAG
ncbi:EAL domain-containing protein [Blastococcus sp. CT_GayMR16]|uniref:putative bifunctional diguanylate cyclase/phosphodiesterase n=1 Tax=Blastococcus sp. CT_GayMR16 TaxID=2559607 RepID=UPI00107331D1|nr:EAL domain-containing protein [Blastococcus sp. CT_GayMR16]TFV89892.1 EAL domain-containing protein [Blastococcus sp. CT_GayMR16]